MRKLSLAILLLFLSTPLFAKMYEPPRSFALQDKSLEKIDRKVVPAINVQALVAEDRERGKNTRQPLPHRFAVPAKVVYDPDNSGTWENLPDGRLWRLRIHADNAKTMNLGITGFNMPDGAKLWVYNAKSEDVNGPYTNRQRSHRGSLWTPVVSGDEIVVEVFVPTGGGKPAVEISSVNRGYRGFAKNSTPGDFPEGACEIDVVCPQGTPWANQIRGVGVYTLNGNIDCSGSMINNITMDFTPYFLSANHCGVTAANDDTVVMYWNFQSATCGTHGPGSLADNQSGATYRANYAPSDFLLFELAMKPNDLGFNVYYEGWDATGTTPASTVGIHHPQGDVKAISFSNSAPEITAYMSDVVDPTQNHWRVVWDNGTADTSGVTEPGSSGSPLFDTNHRIIGQLHGGPSACGVGPDSLHDYYGRFSVSWMGGGTPSSSLNGWLDPGNTGASAMDGDPHITTLNNVHYDFQGGGEYVALRDADGSELQIRSTPVSTTFFPGPNAYTELATCVSLNTAVAAKVNDHRVSIEPNLSGVPDPSGLQVRVDGTLHSVGAVGIGLGPGGRIAQPSSGSYVINFPNGTVATVVSNYWSSQGKWYLNVDATRGPAASSGGGSPGGSTKHPGGIMAAIPQGSWLSPLSDGTKLGAKPASAAARYDDLYHKFGDSWRVTNADSLFDYAPGTSTDTYTLKNWPKESAPCEVPEMKPVKPLSLEEAQKLCANVENRYAHENCVFDVRATGEPGFAKLYLNTIRIRARSSVIRLTDVKDPTRVEEPATFIATVSLRSKSIATGTVQFMVDGERAGKPMKLDSHGRARWTTRTLKPGEHAITATYKPVAASTVLASTSAEVIHIVK